MDRKRLVPLAAVVVLAAAIIGLKVLSDNHQATVTVSEEIRAALSSGTPVLFVFTYQGDCCESTRKFFEGYGQAVTKGVEDFGSSRLAVVWLDTSLADEGSEKAILGLAAQYDITLVPSVALVDGSGRLLVSRSGLLEPDGLRALLLASLGGG